MKFSNQSALSARNNRPGLRSWISYSISLWPKVSTSLALIWLFLDQNLSSMSWEKNNEDSWRCEHRDGNCHENASRRSTNVFPSWCTHLFKPDIVQKTTKFQVDMCCMNSAIFICSRLTCQSSMTKWWFRSRFKSHMCIWLDFSQASCGRSCPSVSKSGISWLIHNLVRMHRINSFQNISEACSFLFAVVQFLAIQRLGALAPTHTCMAVAVDHRSFNV